MSNAKGNALFLILIAVALFAALSYAVTNSGRGGSGIDREQADILAGQVMQSIAGFQSHLQRLEIIQGYDQVTLNDAAPTSSGTCYIGGASSTPCNTIGAFHAESGLPPLFFASEIRDAAYAGNVQWSLISAQVTIGGVDVATTAQDLLLEIVAVNEDVCDALNRRIRNDTSISTLSTPSSGGSSFSVLGTITDSGYTTVTANPGASFLWALPYEGCAQHTTNSLYYLVYLLEKN